MENSLALNTNQYEDGLSYKSEKSSKQEVLPRIMNQSGSVSKQSNQMSR
jgi:hypothetical protein